MSDYPHTLKQLQDEYAATAQPAETGVDADMARWMGWVWDGHFWTRITTDGEYHHSHYAPDYSGDLNFCAQAEQRIITLGLGAAYAEELQGGLDLWLLGGSAGSEHVDFEEVAQIITASAEARCKAMLSVIGGKALSQRNSF